MLTSRRVVDSDKIWACLITNDSYLPGLLTLAFSLRRVGSKYPLVALHTGSLPDKTLDALSARDIPLQRVPDLGPLPPPSSSTSDGDGSNDWYANDPRFRQCFTKLAVFALTGYARVVLLDADMLVRRNMDELFEIALDGENRLFAAAHACLCNPLHLAHYPRTWTPPNCAYTLQQQTNPDLAQTSGGPAASGMGLLNGGLIVLSPSSRRAQNNNDNDNDVDDDDERGEEEEKEKQPEIYSQITAFLHDRTKATPARLPFADQSLLSDLFRDRWVALPYVYNALKTLRWEAVHGGGRGIWRDENVKNVHYILTPKPWELDDAQPVEEMEDGPDRWWREVDLERRRWEAERGLDGDDEKNE
ncbi:nucleotide-diphospho-sugar transferase [Chaetomidium leptoderma]|uniref:Nucleotide-diphospho-sugar transferase n=1 Tax=Chaetomidium leptoderma TaxID=669021 RepID=A0AAN6VVI9_9PEZI|nr:nucleotide-diphospho-sugar transferase [Chaetomidium leptoderma]